MASGQLGAGQDEAGVVNAVNSPEDEDVTLFLPDVDDVDDDDPAPHRKPNFEPPARRRSPAMLLRNVFIKLRRFRHPPSMEKVLPRLISGSADTIQLRRVLETAMDVYGRAMVETKGNRQDASVLGVMELDALGGQRRCSQWTIAELTGLQSRVVWTSLNRLRQQKLIEPIDNDQWCAEFEMTNPLPVKVPPAARCFDDPIDVLRLDSEELETLPINNFKWLVIEACLQTARDNLASKEAETLAIKSHHEELMAQDQRILEEVSQRFGDHEGVLEDCRRELSRIRWARRHPFVAEVKEEQRAEGDVHTGAPPIPRRRSRPIPVAHDDICQCD